MYEDIDARINNIDILDEDELYNFILYMETTYKFKKLPIELSDKLKIFYSKTFPEDLITLFPERLNLYTLNDKLVSNGYIDIIIGNYGAYLEISDKQILLNKLIKVDENDKQVKYTHKEYPFIKIYKQIVKVNFASYKVGMYYILPFELKIL